MAKKTTTKRTRTKKETAALAVIKNDVPEPMFNRDQIELLKRTIAYGLTDDEFAMFVRQCIRTKLDPFARQIFAIKRRQYDSKRKEYVEKVSIETSVDGFRLIAERTGKYMGQVGPFWCGEDGVWRDVWLSSDTPRAAKVGVMRHGFSEPLYTVAKFDTYAQRSKDGSLIALWAKGPELMIAKCAESLALRRAFPQDLSGLYTSDEMGMVDNVYETHHNKNIIDSQPATSPVTSPATSSVTSTCVDGTDYKKVALDAIHSSQSIKQLTIRGETAIKPMIERLSEEDAKELRREFSTRMIELIKAGIK
jgi:phage recombination protein Bet